VVNKNAATRHGSQSASITQYNRPQIVIVSDTRKYEIGTFSRLGWSFGHLTTVFINPGRCLTAGSIVNSDTMSSLL